MFTWSVIMTDLLSYLLEDRTEAGQLWFSEILEILKIPAWHLFRSQKEDMPEGTSDHPSIMVQEYCTTILECIKLEITISEKNNNWGGVGKLSYYILSY